MAAMMTQVHCKQRFDIREAARLDDTLSTGLRTLILERTSKSQSSRVLNVDLFFDYLNMSDHLFRTWLRTQLAKPQPLINLAGIGDTQAADGLVMEKCDARATAANIWTTKATMR